MTEKERKHVRVWYHIPTDQLGEAITQTMFGTIFFFEPYKENEILKPRFCNFVDDPRDKTSFLSKDFVDLGPL